MATALMVAPTGGGGIPPGESVETTQRENPLTLYITLGPDHSFKAGTCAHCVILEKGRPARAWDSISDRDLDFDRETLLANLAELGIQITERRAYVCP